MKESGQDIGRGPSCWLQDLDPYTVPGPDIPTDLYLSGNEGATPPASVLESLKEVDPEILRSYPDSGELRSQVAETYDISPKRVLVTAGADEGLNSFCRALLDPERNFVMPVPTFVMLDKYARLTGAGIKRVSWKSGSYPVERVISAVDKATVAVSMVSPNNPTGAVVTKKDLRQVSERLDGAYILLDHAYVEFADEDDDLTETALELPNVVVMRTLSKAYGLAGIRVGFALGPQRVIHWMKAVTNPYSVSALSLHIAHERLSLEYDDVRKFVTKVRKERDRLTTLLEKYAKTVYPSSANFVLADYQNADWVQRALAGMGIAVRRFPDKDLLENSIRITCPGDREDFDRLLHALRTVFSPEAILFDLDGVLADVSESYRTSIIKTAKAFDVEITEEDVVERKKKGDANNDWEVTHQLLKERGKEVKFEQVKCTFERFYQGTEEEDGLWRKETFIGSESLLEELAGRYSLGLVTGRPRKDAQRFLEQEGIDSYFEELVCMEDGPNKPDPYPVNECLKGLNVKRAWFVGDTPDDIQAARTAGVMPVGVISPMDGEEMRNILRQTGAATILNHVNEITEILS